MSAKRMSAQALMKKCKRGAAAYVHAECLNTNSPHQLDDLLDILLDPSTPIDDWEMIDWCKWIISGGKTPDEFASLVRRYDNATTCGLVWTANFVAYRCRTCGISPCMSLCADCFQKGNHIGHDFNMFRSQAGGACDCGDPSVMKDIGFCDRHGAKAQVNKPSAPNDLMCVAEHMMPRVILRLIHHLREKSQHNGMDSYLLAINDADGFITMIHDFSTYGAAMRSVMTSAITNPQLYKSLTGVPGTNPEKAHYQEESHRLYQIALQSLPNPEPPEEYKDCPCLQVDLHHKTFLEELVFWTVKFEFPQKIVCLLLNMLPDPDYKESLTEAFVLHYSRISMMLEKSGDPDTLSNRVVHVSVQLFSNEGLALRMVEKMNLLHVMVISLRFMMSQILIEPRGRTHGKHYYLVDCGRQVMKEHCYWPLVSDLNNVLSHRPVAYKFMSDDTLLDMWFDFLTLFQGMNLNHRERHTHIEFEPNTYYAAFSAELEASAYPMWALVSHLTDSSTVDLTKRVLTSCKETLTKWIDGVGFTWKYDPDNISFHIPLHRYLAVFMCQAIRHQGLQLREILNYDTDRIFSLMVHPLRVQISYYEIICGMWVRNGLQIKGQAMTYVQCNFCNSMVDADLYFLQVCCTLMNPESFIDNIFDRFHVLERMSFAYNVKRSTRSDPEYDLPMLESCLLFLATLMSIRTNLGTNDASLSQLELVTLLCISDKTHSQLIELMPERCGNAQSRDFETILSEVADYKAPNLEASGNMQQGMYVPRPSVWEHMYDPIHVLLRAMHRRDFQTSMDRFTEYVHQTGKLPSSSTPWPPYRQPGPVHPAYDDPRIILRSKSFHAAALIILFQAVHKQNVTEHSMALLIYLLEMTVDTAEKVDDASQQVCSASTYPEVVDVKDKYLHSFYKTDWLSYNLRCVIPYVHVDPPSNMYCYADPDSSDESLIDWEDAEEYDIGPGGMTISELSTSQVGSREHAALPSSARLAVLGCTEIVPASSVAAVAALASRAAVTSQSTSYVQEVNAILVSNFDHPLTGTEIVPAHHASLLSGGGSGHSDPLQGGSSSGSAPDFLQGEESFVFEPSSSEVVPSTSGQRSQRSKTFVPDNLDYTVEVNESIITLLLKLHSQLAGTPDSFNLDAPEPNESADSRIGDGPFFIGKLLRKIAALDTLCRDAIREARGRLWPKNEQEEEMKAKEAKEREERRRKAKERQQKLMAEFASRQQQFMQKAMETEDDASPGMEWNDEQTSTLMHCAKEYDCVICNQATPSTEDKPMGIVVLMQSTSVLGHKRTNNEEAYLPTTDEENLNVNRSSTLASEFDKRIEELNLQFDSTSWQLAINLGWEGGVYVQTCGHHLHLECLKTYLSSLRSQQRQQSVAVDRGEYSCPLCRQLANSVLPLPPQMGENSAVVLSRASNLPTMVLEISNLLKEKPIKISNMTDAMAKSMEDMTNSTLRKFKQKCPTPTSQSLFLFVNSVARTNLEIELIQRRGTLCKNTEPSAVNSSQLSNSDASNILTPQRSCLVPLLHVLAMHARLLTTWAAWKKWQFIAGVEDDADESPMALAPVEKEVPILLHDPVALLTQFVLLLPLHLDQEYFSCIVKVMFNLLFMQIVAQLTSRMTEAERNNWRRKEVPTESLSSLDETLALTISQLEQGNLYIEDDTENPAASQSVDLENLDVQIQQLCLPYMRVASLLRHHLYEQALPNISNPADEFECLAHYLNLVNENQKWPHVRCSMALNWPVSGGISVATSWLQELSAFVNRSQIAARYLLSEQHLTWKQPRLMQLPDCYDKIFQFYHRRQCQFCRSIPREASICLLCGALICLKENCCKALNICEAVQHSIDCGGGTGLYLVVTSSYIIVIRGKRACLWGSVYLDSFGEEDRELKRGKPLYLSKGRYQLLENQWLSHKFDHTNKKWVWHRDAL